MGGRRGRLGGARRGGLAGRGGNNLGFPISPVGYRRNWENSGVAVFLVGRVGGGATGGKPDGLKGYFQRFGDRQKRLAAVD